MINQVDYYLISFLISTVGMFVLARRIIPRKQKRPLRVLNARDLPKVSIVVPARNEEHNLHRLLPSLHKLDYPNVETIVVNDHSTDRTKTVALSYGAKVIDGQDLPPGWNGKNWACHQSIPHVDGEIILFTDADTYHLPDSLKKAVSFFLSEELDLMSSFPYHKLNHRWEKLLGPFHSMVIAACAPYQPRPNHLFCIGQYMMFSKASYMRQRGHEDIWFEYPDDLALANRCLQEGGKYGVYSDKPLFEVQMYNTFREFIKGWRRNFLAGMRKSRLSTSLEVIFIFTALVVNIGFLEHPIYILPFIVSSGIVLLTQRTFGRFSTWGIILMPFSLMLFLWVSFLAVFDLMTGNMLLWKGRSYTQWTQNSSA